MEPIFDSHAHYDDEAFAPDRKELLLRLNREENVCKIVTAGADLQSSKNALLLAEDFSFIYAASGIHPESAQTFTAETLLSLRALLQHEKLVAVGEIGLDYHYEDACPHEMQQYVFEEQVALANELSLPVIVHDREAHADTLEVLRKFRPRGVVHCFSGSVETAKEVLSLGMYLGLGGVVTFKNAKKALDVAREIPLSRLLLETDAPYLAPEPFRGKRSDSSMIRYSAAAIAAARGEETDTVLRAARENAEALFGI